MAKTNVPRAPILTHEGAKAKHINAELQLRRSVMACMLWEDEFYESGESIADRIKNTIPLVAPEKVAAIAIECREKMKLRHVPLLIVREMARIPSHKGIVASTLSRVVQRADELAEFLAIYWKEGKQSLSAQVKKGLAAAFQKFKEYDLAKYNRDGAVKLRDVLFLCHASPKTEATDKAQLHTRVDKATKKGHTVYRHITGQGEIWKRLVNKQLTIPDTWEVELSASKDKLASWKRLLKDERLGGLAFLRNLRNMKEAGIEKKEIREYAERVRVDRVLPFRFISAAKAVPEWEDILEPLMFKCLSAQERFTGHTVLLIDGSGSMDAKISGKSDITRRDAACALAILLRELCDDVRIIGFSTIFWDLPSRRGFALRDAINANVIPEATMLGKVVRYAQQKPCDRIIVITDEQSHDPAPDPKGRGYVINVASNQNGIGYGAWTHIDGWSEAVIDYIREFEK